MLVPAIKQKLSYSQNKRFKTFMYLRIKKKKKAQQINRLALAAKGSCVAYFLVAKPWNQSGKFPLFWMSGACVSVNHFITSSFRPPSCESICRSTPNCFSILTGLWGADREAITHCAYSLLWWRLTLKRKTRFLIWLFLFGVRLIWIVVLFHFYLPLSLLPLTHFFYLWSTSQI